jgi:hypothetical protein
VQWWIVAEHLLVPLELYKVIFLVDFKRLTLLTHVCTLDCTLIFHVTKWTLIVIGIIQYFKQLPIYYTFLENNQTPSYANLDSLSYCLSANMHKSPCLANQDGQCKEFLNLPEYLWIVFIQKIKRPSTFSMCLFTIIKSWCKVQHYVALLMYNAASRHTWSKFQTATAIIKYGLKCSLLILQSVIYFYILLYLSSIFISGNSYALQDHQLSVL